MAATRRPFTTRSRSDRTVASTRGVSRPTLVCARRRRRITESTNPRLWVHWGREMAAALRPQVPDLDTSAYAPIPNPPVASNLRTLPNGAAFNISNMTAYLIQTYGPSKPPPVVVNSNANFLASIEWPDLIVFIWKRNTNPLSASTLDYTPIFAPDQILNLELSTAEVSTQITAAVLGFYFDAADAYTQLWSGGMIMRLEGATGTSGFKFGCTLVYLPDPNPCYYVWFPLKKRAGMTYDPSVPYTSYATAYQAATMITL